MPSLLLFGPRPARFGWQMFASHSVAPVIVAIRADGSRRAPRVDDYFAFRRGDIAPDSLARLPAHVCRVEPGIERVLVQWRDGGEWELHFCR